MSSIHDEKAINLGATYAREHRYPTRRDWFGRNRDWLGGDDGGAVFSVHYFNANGGEVAYFIPDMDCFHPGELHTFDPPREWHAEILATLSPKRSLS